MQHDAEPQKSQDGQLVVNMMWNHRDAPSQWCDRGAFYPVLGGGGITRKLEVHDLVNGELTVKRLSKRHGTLVLMPENAQYPPLPITETTAFEVWGVVTYVIHRV